MLGVWMAPVTAQLMMPFAIGGIPLAARPGRVCPNRLNRTRGRSPILLHRTASGVPATSACGLECLDLDLIGIIGGCAAWGCAVRRQDVGTALPIGPFGVWRKPTPFIDRDHTGGNPIRHFGQKHRGTAIVEHLDGLAVSYPTVLSVHRVDPEPIRIDAGQARLVAMN